jgi:hypothetical protein
MVNLIQVVFVDQSLVRLELALTVFVLLHLSFLPMERPVLIMA